MSEKPVKKSKAVVAREELAGKIIDAILATTAGSGSTRQELIALVVEKLTPAPKPRKIKPVEGEFEQVVPELARPEEVELCRYKIEPGGVPCSLIRGHADKCVPAVLKTEEAINASENPSAN